VACLYGFGIRSGHVQSCLQHHRLGRGDPAFAGARRSACAGRDLWPEAMTFVQLKTAGVLNNDQVDFTRTASILIASQKIASDLYRQVFEVTYSLKSGGVVKAITVSDASNEECSMSDVKVYRVVDAPLSPGKGDR
jgi:hypothetical protein